MIVARKSLSRARIYTKRRKEHRIPKKAQPLQGAVVVIYARYSSHSQNDASIEQQVSKWEEFAACAGLTIIHTYPDRAISGRSDKRAEFRKMIKNVGSITLNAE